MSEIADNQYDILIAGSGFAGSLTALIFYNMDFKVCLIEKGQHPRFAIGESSTPIADIILRELALKYNMPWLHDFSRYGSWQKSHSEIVCGLKRGFSFFKHYPGEKFTTDNNHKNELLVAASSDDLQSDTNWLRSDFDAFLVNKIKETNITYFDLTDIVSAKRDKQWEFQTSRLEKIISIHASFFIDATGGDGLLKKIMGVTSSSDEFLTDSFALFSHFDNVPRWTEMLQKDGIPTKDFPYDPDNSALHQILDEGWLWQLRFNNGRTSLGLVLNNHLQSFKNIQTEEIWNHIIEKYPSISKITEGASLSPQPGKMIRSGRLQRKAEQCYGKGWVALPNTAGFVDPLFSTGIAHSLSGIKKIADIFYHNRKNEDLLYEGLKEYEKKIFEELKLMDLLIAGSYKTMDHFELFNSWSMLYFTATIAYEKRLLKGEPSGYFLNADSSYISDIVEKSYSDLLGIIERQKPSKEDVRRITQMIKNRIEPINTAGLLDPSFKNMYHHTAASL
ncbi:MAG TPA: tryptophan 7-halogenase [Hanamia sp.]|nr:tryptophan 7-halogenase [Hanamia sp.]